MRHRSANELHAKEGSRAKPRKIAIGSNVIITHGMPRAPLQDVYHFALTMGWPAFIGLFAGIFLLMNALFACVYMLGDHPIANQFPHGFLGAFFFSVETLATVGYGDMHPATLYAHAVATVEIFTGMASIALMTGVMFARFSRPRARILFAESLVIGLVDGSPTLTIRAANARQNVIVEATARLRMFLDEVTAEGSSLRRIYDLQLRREQQPMFILGWSIMHTIDSASPLHGHTLASLAAKGAAFVLTLDGVDETTSQSMQSRYTYAHATLRWDHRYVDLMRVDETGLKHMDYSKFHDTQPMEALIGERLVAPEAAAKD